MKIENNRINIQIISFAYSLNQMVLFFVCISIQLLVSQIIPTQVSRIK